ncbi:hypothetical protein Cgig2_009409 [Carnegiea gigantea]|uniref:Fe2OG dioxygenase domain-containing protein n=1 Tax=Carnegiea gigantea TaxID=171969 RepID=A0A9Q1Q6N8_9CARY|nr:hypothetical protein Cgig2_009409 [Carnegiea gigantea]
MAEVDPAFIQAIEHRPKPITTEDEAIPVIDLSPISIYSLDDRGHLPKNVDIDGLITKIGEACAKRGFFQVINHGVPLEKLEKLELIAREFFSLPLEEKRRVSRDEGNPLGYYDAEHTKNVRDWKEVFDFIGKDHIVTPVTSDDLEPKIVVNRWPEYPPQLREIGEEYAREVEKLAFKLMELIALSLGLPSTSFREFFEDHTSLVRLNHYPPCPSPDLALGVGRHKDSGGLTILAQDAVGGLEVRRKSDGEWIRVKPNPGAFIINIGDIVQVWTNGKCESVEHRVKVNSEKDRVSFPFFFNPAHYVISWLTKKTLQNTKKEYSWGAFFATRRKSNLKKLDADNIQISHFQINA